MGAAVGDYDADGDDDLYVTCFGPNVMLRNDAAAGGLLACGLGGLFGGSFVMMSAQPYQYDAINIYNDNLERRRMFMPMPPPWAAPIPAPQPSAPAPAPAPASPALPTDAGLTD